MIRIGQTFGKISNANIEPSANLQKVSKLSMLCANALFVEINSHKQKTNFLRFVRTLYAETISKLGVNKTFYALCGR